MSNKRLLIEFEIIDSVCRMWQLVDLVICSGLLSALAAGVRRKASPEDGYRSKSETI